MKLRLALVLSLLVGAPAVAADVRALVVGVDSGPGQRSLNGAQELARRFRAMGFDTDLVLDPDKPALEAAMDRLGDKARGSRLVIFAYGGHGIEFHGKNYLVPRKAVIATAADIGDRLVPLSRLFELLEDRREVAKLFILDACRQIPSDRWLETAGPMPEGLANPTADMPINSFIAFAAPPGKKAFDGNLGRYAPFTRALLAELPARGLPLQRIFDRTRERVLTDTDSTQQPWDSSSLASEVTLVPPVTLEARFTRCDDVAFLFLNGVLARSCPDAAQNGPIELVPGRNELTVGIYNQKTYQGQRPPIRTGLADLDALLREIAGVAEGWSYALELMRDSQPLLTCNGVPCRELATGEDPPSDEHHGRFFLASRVVLDLDADSGRVEVISSEPAYWQSH